MINFTIIIPHYNIPLLLERCIKSIPIRNDIQIIVVDDCSPNITEVQKIINQNSSDRNIEFYSTPLGGSAGRARNIGLKHAKGKWLIFADADDFFDDPIVNILDSYINDSADIIFFRCQSVMSNDISKHSSRIGDNSKYYTTPITDEIEIYFRIKMQVPWGKMIKRNLVTNNYILFDETRYANDAMFSVLTGCKAKTIKIINVYGYVVTDRPDGLCGKFFNKPKEAGIRAKVALRVNKVIINHGYNSGLNDVNMFLKLVVLNQDFSTLKEIFRDSEKYGVTKHEILQIVRTSGRRYYPIYIWLKLMSWL